MNFPVMMFGELQDTEMDLEVMLNTKKLCGGSSGAERHRQLCFIHAVNPV